jgi:hypothetical protein
MIPQHSLRRSMRHTPPPDLRGQTIRTFHEIRLLILKEQAGLTQAEQVTVARGSSGI